MITIYTSRVDSKMVSESLTYLGIPHIATRDGFIAPRQLILRMGLPIVEEPTSPSKIPSFFYFCV